MKTAIALATGLLLAATPILSQTTSPTPPPVQPQPAPTGPVLPANTVLQLIAPNEISSKEMKVGDTHQVQVANDVVEGGKVVIPRGAPVASVVTWRTGEGDRGQIGQIRTDVQRRYRERQAVQAEG